MPIPRPVATAPRRSRKTALGTPKRQARISDEIMSDAIDRARQVDPAACIAGVIRYAVALLAGISPDEAAKHLREATRGPKPKTGSKHT